MMPRTRLVLGLCGLAMAAPASPAVASPADGPQAGYAAPTQPSAGTQPAIGLETSAGYAPTAGYAPSAGPATYAPSAGYAVTSGYKPTAAPAAAPAGDPKMAARSPHNHKGLFAWRHCVECQRAHVKKHDGVNIPPPPSQPGMVSMVIPGETIVSGPTVIGDPHGTVVMESQATGVAVVGPGGTSSEGFAVAGESQPSAEPTPVGVARGAQNPLADPRMAAMSPRPGAGSYDASVVATGIPAAPNVMSGPGHDRPHIIGHILGIPKFGKLQRDREDKKRAQHAAISYGDANQKINELPASMVYPNGSH